MKKIIQTISALALVALTVPAFAYAGAIEDLQAQIAELSSRLAALQGGNTVTYSGNCSNTQFTQKLELGVTDSEVAALQRILNQSGDTQVASYGAGSPGYETDYFGPMTRLAVIRYQNKYRDEILAPVGLYYGTGIVGEATRAHLNSNCIVGGSVLGESTNTGTVQTTGSNSSSNTSSNSNSNYNNYGLNGSAGSISINSYSADVEDNVTTGSGTYVLGYKVRADGSDVRVTHMRIVLNYNGADNNNLSRYFRSFDIYADGQRIARTDATEFNRDYAGQYSKTIALDNVSDAIVRMGSGNQRPFYVRAVAQDFIDSALAGSGNSWTVKLDNTRYVDATGVTLSDNTTVSNAGVYVEKLSTSGEVKVRISAGTANPIEQVVFVSDTSSGDRVTMLEFKIKAEGTRVQFDQLKVNVNTTGSSVANQATEFRLERDGQVIDTEDATAVSGGILTFNLDNLDTIEQDAYATYRVVARMQKIGTGTFSEGSTMTVSFNLVKAQDRNGDNITNYSGSATGRTQTFRSIGLNLVRVSTSQSVNSNSTNPSASYAEFRMQVRVTASGDDIWVPLTIDTTGTTTGVVYNIEDSGNNVIAGGASHSVSHLSGGSRDGNYIKIADGESAVFETVVTFDPTAAGQYRLQFVGVGYTTTGATGLATAQILASPEYDFQSSNVYIPN